MLESFPHLSSYRWGSGVFFQCSGQRCLQTGEALVQIIIGIDVCAVYADVQGTKLGAICKPHPVPASPQTWLLSALKDRRANNYLSQVAAVIVGGWRMIEEASVCVCVWLKMACPFDLAVLQTDWETVLCPQTRGLLSPEQAGPITSFKPLQPRQKGAELTEWLGPVWKALPVCWGIISESRICFSLWDIFPTWLLINSQQHRRNTASSGNAKFGRVLPAFSCANRSRTCRQVWGGRLSLAQPYYFMTNQFLAQNPDLLLQNACKSLLNASFKSPKRKIFHFANVRFWPFVFSLPDLQRTRS